MGGTGPVVAVLFLLLAGVWPGLSVAHGSVPGTSVPPSPDGAPSATGSLTGGGLAGASLWHLHQGLPAVRPMPGAGPGPLLTVNETVAVGTGAVLPGNVATYPNALDPNSLTYDNGTQQYFVCGSASDQVEVLWSSNLTRAADIPVGRGPMASVYDAADGEVYVANALDGTVSVLSDSSDTVVATVAVGTYPLALVFDNRTDQVFVANQGSANVTVIDGSTHAVAASIRTLADPDQLAFDPSSRHVFVGSGFGGANWTGAIVVVSDTNDSVIANLTLSGPTQALVLDPVGDVLYASNPSAWQIATINATTDQFLQNVTPFGDPGYMAIDPATYQLFDIAEVGNSYQRTGEVEVFSLPSLTKVASLATPDFAGPLYFAGNGTVAVLLPPLDLLWLISDATDTVRVQFAPGASVSGFAIDPTSGQLFVSDYYSDLVRVFNQSMGLRQEVEVGPGPSTLAYDAPLRQILVAQAGNGGSNLIAAANDTALSGPWPWDGTSMSSVGFAAYSGDDFGAPAGSNAILAAPDTDLSKSSVAARIAGVVTSFADDPKLEEMYAAVSSSVPSGNLVLAIQEFGQRISEIPVAASPTALAYDPAKREMFVVEEGAAEVQVISDQNHAIVANLTLGSYPANQLTAATYDPVLGGILITDSAQNTLEVISDQNNSLLDTVAVGQQPGSVLFNPADWSVLVGNAGSGTISVLRHNLSAIATGVTFAVTPPSCPAPTVNGLAVSLGSATPLYRTTYALSAGSCPGFVFYQWQTNGAVGVANATSANTSLAVAGPGNVTAVFLAPVTPSYPVYLNETGLPAGFAWSANLAGILLSGATPSFSASFPNGTYGYQLLAVPGFAGTPAVGVAYVHGGPVTLPIVFTPSNAGPTVYLVTFEADGLPFGTLWGVHWNGTDRTSTGPTITDWARNGSYAFAVGSVPGWVPSPASGTVTVAGAGVAVTIQYSPVVPPTYPVTFHELGLPNGTVWGIEWNGTPRESTASTLGQNAPNGTFSYRVIPVAGFTPTPANGSVRVFGVGAAVTISFQPNASSNPAAGVQGPGVPILVDVLGAIGVAAVAGTVWLLRRRASSSSRDESPGA